ncbi:hypothetical protein ACFVVM_32995 [Nocardia sp. NPDC058176]|uniref:hypothetical protein n=1 Tax=Nocardia sp. NPDC058176 TaxID=3346368 RepID=UPI0036DE2FA5
MAVRLRIPVLVRPTIDDPLGRSFIGWYPGRAAAALWEGSRGLWKINRARLRRERFALIVYGDVVVAVGEITGWVDHDDRVELIGPALAAGHPVYDAWIGRRDPAGNNSRNPVSYIELPQERTFVERPCRCGCGELASADFLPGHDVRAMQNRVRALFGGSALAFIDWVDEMAERHGVPTCDDSGGTTTRRYLHDAMPDVPHAH